MDDTVLKEQSLTDIIDCSLGTNDFIDENIIKKHISESNYELNKYPIIEYDLLKNESLTILNTIATAEGAIAKSIEETDFNLASSNILVLGFGRVGKMLAYKLKQMGANVYVEARKQEDLAWIESYGYNAVDLKNVNKKLCKVDIIFNTIPKLILDKSRLILIKKETLIIDFWDYFYYSYCP